MLSIFDKVGKLHHCSFFTTLKLWLRSLSYRQKVTSFSVIAKLLISLLVFLLVLLIICKEICQSLLSVPLNHLLLVCFLINKWILNLRERSVWELALLEHSYLLIKPLGINVRLVDPVPHKKPLHIFQPLCLEFSIVYKKPRVFSLVSCVQVLLEYLAFLLFLMLIQVIN